LSRSLPESRPRYCPLVRPRRHILRRKNMPSATPPSPSLSRARYDIAAFRTAALGGHVWACDHYGSRQYRYHSSRHRHCPACHGGQTRCWLARQPARLLPCAYFLASFTPPALSCRCSPGFIRRRHAPTPSSPRRAPVIALLGLRDRRAAPPETLPPCGEFGSTPARERWRLARAARPHTPPRRHTPQR
jgi:hypothetical protein